jgi:RNA polymerase sigma-70 factor, ECF subfamily
VEWLDDVKRWKAGDAAATERLREYVTPFVHGALLARMPHDVANALMPEALITVMANADAVTKESGFVLHAVAVARRLAKLARHAVTHERPSTDSIVVEGRQWLERLRSFPEELIERVVWRLVEGVPGPELMAVLELDEGELREGLERGIGDSLVPPQSLRGAPYVWDLSGEPSTELARAETFATALRFDPLYPPELVVDTAATVLDLSSSTVNGARPEANPYGDFRPTLVVREPQPNRPSPVAGSDEGKTEGGFNLPAAARGVVSKTELETPALKTSGRQAVGPTPGLAHRTVLKGARRVEDERASKRRNASEDRPTRKKVATVLSLDEGVSRTATFDATAQTRIEHVDDLPTVTPRVQARGKVHRDRGEEPGRKRTSEVQERRVRLEVTDSATSPSMRDPISFVTERLVLRPVRSPVRLIVIGAIVAGLAVASLWRLGWL